MVGAIGQLGLLASCTGRIVMLKILAWGKQHGCARWAASTTRATRAATTFLLDNGLHICDHLSHHTLTETRHLVQEFRCNGLSNRIFTQNARCDWSNSAAIDCRSRVAFACRSQKVTNTSAYNIRPMLMLSCCPSQHSTIPLTRVYQPPALTKGTQTITETTTTTTTWVLSAGCWWY